MVKYPCLVAESSVNGGRANRRGMLKNGHGGGFLGDASVNHDANSDGCHERNNHQRNEDVAITGRKSPEDKEEAENENHGIGNAQDYGGPSQVLDI